MLAKVEEENSIRIVHAGYGCSSRTLGTTHEASDHDVKLIFVLRRSDYFGLKPKARTFSRRLAASGGMAEVEHPGPAGTSVAIDDGQVDFSGWEARHACRLIANGNPTVLELLHSPVELLTSRWSGDLQAAAAEASNQERLARGWLQHAKQNYYDYIQRVERPVRKKYVHVLRRLLCLSWLRSHRGDTDDDDAGAKPLCWPPARLLDLAQAAAEAGALAEAELETVEALVSQRDLLPQCLPHDIALNALLERLLSSEDPRTSGAQWPMSPMAPEDRMVRMHALCAAIVEDLAP